MWLTGFVNLASGAPDTGITFRETLEKHLAAVQGRDLKALEETLTRGDKLILIFNGGEKLNTRQQFIDFHKTWFSENNWQWKPEVLQVIETPGLAHVLLKYTYSWTDKENKPKQSESFLALTFAKEKDGWGLVFDQNTKIQTP
jgi:ketosteroid isomerase-like protein